MTIDKQGSTISAIGSQKGTTANSECFKKRAEEYVKKNYVYTSCSSCNNIRIDFVKINFETPK